MEEGPPEPAFRSRFQTSPSCCGKEPWWWASDEKFGHDPSRWVSERRTKVNPSKKRRQP